MIPGTGTIVAGGSSRMVLESRLRVYMQLPSHFTFYVGIVKSC